MAPFFLFYPLLLLVCGVKCLAFLSFHFLLFYIHNGIGLFVWRVFGLSYVSILHGSFADIMEFEFFLVVREFEFFTSLLFSKIE